MRGRQIGMNRRTWPRQGLALASQWASVARYGFCGAFAST